MTRTTLILISLLILLQNTCPYGFAGKTTFVPKGIKTSCPGCAHAPLKNPDEKGALSKEAPINRVYLLNVSQELFFKSFFHTGRYPVSADERFKEVIPEPLFKPPTPLYS